MENDVPFKEYVDSQLAEVRRAAELAAIVPTESVPLREYIEAVLDEQRRGMIVAEQEREKAAAALREELQRRIADGDNNLREHVAMQIEGQKAALLALQRELNLITEASAAAIAKAEAANEKRFESVNEFRAQLASQTASFLPREVAEAQFAELRRAIDDLTAKIAKLV